MWDCNRKSTLSSSTCLRSWHSTTAVETKTEVANTAVIDVTVIWENCERTLGWGSHCMFIALVETRKLLLRAVQTTEAWIVKFQREAKILPWSFVYFVLRVCGALSARAEELEEKRTTKMKHLFLPGYLKYEKCFLRVIS